MRRSASRPRGKNSGANKKKENLTRPASPATVSFDFIKGNFFRGIHVDGLWGGFTPHGLMALTFYSERFPIPNQTTHYIGPDYKLGEEIQSARVTRSAIVREAEVCVYMDMKVATSFRNFLNERISEHEVAGTKVTRSK